MPSRTQHTIEQSKNEKQYLKFPKKKTNAEANTTIV